MEITTFALLMRNRALIHRKARAYDKRMAEAPKQEMRRSHALEGINVSMPGGGDHPSALAKNRHHTSYEPGPTKIPD
jgi:hypothetical protein